MAADTICSDFARQENKTYHCFHCFPIYCHEVMGLDAMILVFVILSFKPAFSPSSFTFIKRVFSSSSLSSISSLQFSCSVMSDSLRPHESQHARPPCPSPTHVHRVGDAIQPSHPLSSPFPPAPNPSQHQSLFQ